MDSLKNIAILAHIDAGKTTLSERILYQGKTIHDVGDVDDGLATMDYLAEERRRGITIEAGISFYNYKKEKVNLIDTPGHIDFGSEVDCVLKAIDGAVLVVSGVRGVQTQTLVNHQKLLRAKTPTIVMLNKIDLPDFKFDETLIDLEERFEKPILMLSLPCQTEAGWGVIDVIAQKLIMTSAIESREFEAVEIPKSHIYNAQSSLNELIEAVAEIDDEVMECFLEKQIPSAGQLYDGLAKLVKANKIMAVYCGSAKQNIGVRQLMNGIKFLLPTAAETIQDSSLVGVAQVIKVRHHPEYPKVYLLKVLSEEINRVSLFKNSLFSINAEELTPSSHLNKGEVCALNIDLPYKIGDEILADGQIGKQGEIWEYDSLLHFKVEAKVPEEAKKMGEGLQFFADIEPSMQLKYDEGTGTYVVGAVGEVFFDVLVCRMRDEFGVEINYGYPEVEKKEAFIGKTLIFKEEQTSEWGKLEIEGEISEIESDSIKLIIDVENLEAEDLVSMVLQGAFEELSKRGVLGLGALVNCQVKISKLKSTGRLLPGLLAKLALHAIESIITKESIKLLIPMVSLKLVAPEEFSNALVADLNNRLAKINKLDSNGKNITLIAELALERTFGYTTEMRNLTRGRGSHEIEYVGHY